MFYVLGGICMMIGLFFMYWSVIITYAIFTNPKLGFAAIMIMVFAPLALFYISYGWLLLLRKVKFFMVVLLPLMIYIKSNFAIQLYWNDGNVLLMLLFLFDIILFICLLFLFIKRMRTEKARLIK